MAVQLAAEAGLDLDPWQQYVLEHSLAETEDDRWAAFEVGLIVPRQNGKGSILEARELAGLVLFGERLILHSAHEFKTASEAFLRVKMLFDNNDDLRKKVARIRTSHGDEGIELRNGCRLRFVARSTGSGRGFTGDLIILDEAYNLSAESMAALLPTLSARPNPQLWYTSSTGMESSTQLDAVRRRGLSGNSSSLAFFEWSVADGTDPDDRDGWAQANPALGIRISEDFVEREREAMPGPQFERERLGVWMHSGRGTDIDADAWRASADEASTLEGMPCVSLEVSPMRWSAVAVAGKRPDGLYHVEVPQFRSGTDWAPEYVAGVCERNGLSTITLDPSGPAGSLIPRLMQLGINVTPLTGREMAQACGLFVDTANDRGLRHLDDEYLNAAVAGSVRRTMADALVWSRRESAMGGAPLIAATAALWAASQNTGGANVW